MLAIINDFNGHEVARYTLDGSDVLDCDEYAERYANECGYDLDDTDGEVPECSGDFTVIIQETPGSVICWNSQSYFFKGE